MVNIGMRNAPTVRDIFSIIRNVNCVSCDVLDDNPYGASLSDVQVKVASPSGSPKYFLYTAIL